jgi:hypothetical protein
MWTKHLYRTDSEITKELEFEDYRIKPDELEI